jgi:hypothetical protein
VARAVGHLLVFDFFLFLIVIHLLVVVESVT